MIEFDPSELSDEELDRRLNEEPSTDEPEESEDSEVEEEQEEVDGSEEESESETETEADEEEIPEWVPEQLREHYKSGNKDELAKAAAHFQHKVNEISRFKPILDYWQNDPTAFQRYVESIANPSSSQETTGDQSSPIDEVLGQIEEGEITETEGLKKIVEIQERKFQESIQNFQSAQETEFVSEQNEKSLQNFINDIQDIHKFDQAELVEFIGKVAQTVNPTGSSKRYKSKYYTEKDFKNAFKVLYSDEYEKKLEDSIKNKLLSELNSAEENGISTPSSSQTAQDGSVAMDARFGKAKNRREAEEVAEDLSDEELNELLAKKGLSSPIRYF